MIYTYFTLQVKIVTELMSKGDLRMHLLEIKPRYVIATHRHGANVLA